MIAYQRNIESYAADLLGQYPVLAIIGARQVGKTFLSKVIAPDFAYLDLERDKDFDRLAHDPEFFFAQYPNAVTFDEAQLYPKLFSLLRSIIDDDRQQKGRFIITGSSSPELLSQISESLAGRIAILELGTLKANEFYQEPLKEWYSIFHGPVTKEKFEQCTFTRPRSIEETQRFWLRGGYPDAISGADSFFKEWMIDYQSTYLNRDIAHLFPKLDKIAYRRFISILARLSGKQINKSDIGRAIGISETTVSHYLDIASGTFMWRQIPSFSSAVTKSIMKMPKGYIRDSGLLHHLLNLYTLDDLQSDTVVGFSFESFVIEELLKGIQDSGIRNVTPYYYRTRGGAEVDLILEGSFGRLPIEIKYGQKVARKNLRSLEAFIEQYQCPFGILINQSTEVEWLTNSIVQLPAGHL